MKTKLKAIELALIFGLCFAILAGFTYRKEQQELASKIIRLHVIANSDSKIDQNLKLEVRDRVIEEVSKLCVPGDSEDMAEERIISNLAQIEKSAEDVVKNSGFAYEVNAKLTREDYSTREYENFSLPAGEYNSLKITIGEGNGKNWWCVVFPPLCYSATEEFLETAKTAGLSESEVELIVEDSDNIIIKFKILEYLQQILRFLGK